MIDLSSYKYTELHTFFAKKFGKKDGSDNIPVGDAVVIDIDTDNGNLNDLTDNANNVNAMGRIKMNAEIFEGIDTIKMDTSSMAN
eukprot:UN01335